MKKISSRRSFLHNMSALGMGSVAAAGWAGNADDASTPSATEGPFYASNAPYRAKISPVGAIGTAMIVQGRVLSAVDEHPLAGAVLDVWQADHQGEYSSGKGEDFDNRARSISSETGTYEFETVHPVAYAAGRGRWRSAHIHCKIACVGYQTLTTQLFFAGDTKQDVDWLFNAELVRPVFREKNRLGSEVEQVEFDILLTPLE